MNVKRVVTLGVIGAALAVWLAAAATSPVRQPAAIAVPKPSTIDASGAELAREITRLHERLRPTAEPIEARDLFHYAPRAARRNATSAPGPLVPENRPVEATAPAPSPLKLVGIAEDDTATGPVRTAIVSGFGQLFVVKEQEAVTLRYRVERISSDAVELVDINDHTTLSLILK